MKALTYHGPKDVRVETVCDPTLQAPDDIVLRVTATAICGSDLHIYRGKMPAMEHGDILGHEFMGIVEEVGPEVSALKVGDRVVVPFNGQQGRQGQGGQQNQDGGNRGAGGGNNQREDGGRSQQDRDDDGGNRR